MAKGVLGRKLVVLTRGQGVRDENPLLTYPADKYYPPSQVRTPALREEADTLEKVEKAKRYRTR